MDNKFSVS